MSIVSDNIARVRKDRGYTQERMAKELGVSRPTYIAIESGSRDINIAELESIASVLRTTVWDLISGSIHGFEKFQQMYFYILRKFENGVPKTKLAKLLYLADFSNYYYNLEPMSGVQYIRRQYGPVADAFFSMTDSLYDDGKIDIELTDGGAMLLKSNTREIDDNLLSDADKSLMDKICDAWKDKRTQAIVNFTHEQKPWKSCRDGEYIPYSLIIQEDPEHVYAPVAD